MGEDSKSLWKTLAREMTILLIFIYKEELRLLAWNLYITEIMDLVVRGKNHCTEDKKKRLLDSNHIKFVVRFLNLANQGYKNRIMLFLYRS